MTENIRKLIGLIVTVLGSVATTYMSPEHAQLITGLLASAYGVFVGGNMYEHKTKATGGNMTAPTEVSKT